MTRYMLIVKSDENAEAGVPPVPAVLAKVEEMSRELSESGALLMTQGLAPSKEGALVRNTDGRRTVIGGPYAEAKELIAGFALVDVRDKSEAIELAWRMASASGAESIEVRAVAEFG